MRYVLHPGYMTSKNDGQQHFVGGPRLARLYGVDMRDCVFGDVPEYRKQDGDVHLWPDYHGNYALPSNAGANSAALKRSPMEAEGRNES